ncbi:Hsp33 family molecular chaperone HslO [Gluconobacter morbifer]|uniref:Heat shock protein HSP33 n=1 Tax=Gluconobacter morbifer G707 TaxID=1088869 RepID=G6XMD1_9PROT|nr:Hsp33 family molecular chaperone HslO [Gluconobacter morbifer]EHH67029.1 heat shock protein HSP33 [Gluconobacter morbifer G707]
MDTPAFLDTNRPAVPNLVVAGGIVPFHLEHSPVRGRLVRLGPLADALLSRHAENPDAVLTLMGKAVALVAAMASALKFKGSFSLQVKGDGPVSLLAADATDTGDVRSFARLEENADREALPETDRGLLGNGYLAFTVDQGAEMERHQGIVELTGGTLADMAMHYFQTSEQHDCWIKLFCRKTVDGWQAGALVLERIAEEGGIENAHPETRDDDAWETACTFGETLQDTELFDETLGSDTLIFRLFGTLGVQVAPPRALAYGCRCSRARLASVLERFGTDDLDHMAEDGTITMKCEFCNTDFRFARDELGKQPE